MGTQLPLPKKGAEPPIFGPPLVARAEAYGHAKFHLDPSNRLATVHKCHRQDRTGQTDKTDNSPSLVSCL